MKQGNLPVAYLNSVLDVYEYALQKSPNYSDNAAGKVKQEILHGLGNAFSSRYLLFMRFWECTSKHVCVQMTEYWLR